MQSDEIFRLNDFQTNLFTGLAATVMFEKGSDICLNFKMWNAQRTNVIKRIYFPICISLGENFEPTAKPWADKAINCSKILNTSTMSVCFGDFQLPDAGLFSLCDSTSNTSRCFENIELKVLGKLSLKFYQLQLIWNL